MPEKLEPISVLKAQVEDDEWLKEQPTFIVEPEIVELATLYAKIWLKRWEEGTQESWDKNRKRNNYIGLIGQKCFEITLQQLDIPYIPNDPTIDWRGKKNYDFKIPNIETIEVKTVDYQPKNRRLLIRSNQWHNSDFVLALKLLDELPTNVKFIGYATKKEVENFTYAENEFPCFKSPCYWEFLDKLHSARQFFNILKQRTEEIW